MVGTRDRVPLGIGLSSEISAGLMPAGAPHAFLSVFLGIRFSRFPGRLVRPAPPLPSVRGARRYITRTPSRGQGAFSPFSREGAPQGPVFPIRPGTTRFGCPSGRAHIPSISPGRGAGGSTGHLDPQRRKPIKCSRARLAKRARSLGTPNTCRAESFEAKSAEGVDASLYIVALCHAEIFPAS